MPGGRLNLPLDADQGRLLASARRATLATIAPDGRPRLVPCCFAQVEGPAGRWTLFTPLDTKPKRASDARRLARVQDITRDPRVTLLVDRWDEDWERLAWLRIEGTARLVWPTTEPAVHAAAVAALRARYRQYLDQRLEELPVIDITPSRITGWQAADPTLT